jgi:formylglycine-generating enzyme required for sulfatase activity
MTRRHRPLAWAVALLAAWLAPGCVHAPHASGPHAAGPAPPPPDMVLVPAGPFVMGTDRTDATGDAADLGLPYTWYSDATPRHTVDLPAFYIDRYELTNARYLTFLNETELPFKEPYGWHDNHPADGTGDYPVTGLNWYEAYLVCQHFGKRLPSEAEWEKAARGTDGRLYPWGTEFDAGRANVATGSSGHLMPVGSFPQGASPYGVEDMIGNAWEWTRDWYKPYPGSTYLSRNYGKQFKVIRGSSYAPIGHFPEAQRNEVVREMSRANYRFSLNPAAGSPDSGVRCAQSVP